MAFYDPFKIDYIGSCKYNHNTVYGLRIKGYGV